MNTFKWLLKREIWEHKGGFVWMPIIVGAIMTVFPVEDEDLFASVWKSVRNRWTWLAINLVTAFIASRVIGAFEGSIEKLVALAALMPIVAGIGGNSGNQTITMIVRAIALGQIGQESERRLYRKELKVALINGLVWGGLLGLIAWWLYGDWRLGAVMTAAISVSDSCFQAGIAPLAAPLSTIWICLAGSFKTIWLPSSALIGPAPLPLAVWQATQLAA